MHIDKFIEITNLLEDNYSKKLKTQILDIWYEELKNYSDKLYYKVAKEIIKKENYMPNLYKIKEYLEMPDWFYANIEENRATDEEINKLEERLKKDE